MCRILRKYWFYSFLAFHLLFDLANLILSIAECVWFGATDSHSERVWMALNILFWVLSSVNATFLSTYGFLYTNTIVGSWVFQQAVSLLLIALGAALVALRGVLLVYIFTGYYTLIVGSAIHAILLITFCAQFLVAPLSGNPILGNWATNLEDLATGVQPSVTDQKLTWRGIRREQSRSSRRGRLVRSAGRMVKSIGRFMYNALFRRIHPVETIPFAFCQNLFALAAVALLLTRSIILLTQLDNEKLPSRTLVEPEHQRWNSESSLISVLVRYPELQGYSPSLSGSKKELVVHNVTIAFQSNDTTSLYNSTTRCRENRAYTFPVIDNVDEDDWFLHYTCDGLEEWKFRGYDIYGFQYIVTTKISRESARFYDMPDIWLVKGLESPDLTTPYLVPPIQPIPEVHTIFHTHYARRKTIASSALWDAVTGAKPAYDAIDLYPWSQVYSRPITSTDDPDNVMLYSSGFIHWPKYLVSSSQTPLSELKQGIAGTRKLVEITEEYRTSSSFDILASIGGLLALLQGVHIFLFGRPLFWGMFGTKLLTPFGFVGRLATRGFRQRLREHYYATESTVASTVERGDMQQHNGVDMTRFLLDYVLDMGPASLPNPEAQGRGPVYGEVQLEDVNSSTMLFRESNTSKTASVYNDPYMSPTKE